MARKKILVIDDEPHIQTMTKTRLNANDYDVILAADGEEGLEKLKSKKPDLVLLDIMMPKVDGYEFLCHLQGVKSVPVIMFTARVRPQEISKAISLGAVDYIVKPFKADDLIDKIQAALKKFS